MLDIVPYIDTILSPSFRIAYSQQFSARYSHQFGPNLSIIADGVYQHILRNWRIQDLNFPVDDVTANLLVADEVTNATAPTFGEITNASNAQEGEWAAIFRF